MGGNDITRGAVKSRASVGALVSCELFFEQTEAGRNNCPALTSAWAAAAAAPPCRRLLFPSSTTALAGSPRCIHVLYVVVLSSPCTVGVADTAASVSETETRNRDKGTTRFTPTDKNAACA